MDAGIYGPGSLAWRINRERVLLLAGTRALLMQLAHPSVALGVAEHSDFRRRPLRRLARTLTLSLDTVFGDLERALSATRRINATHARVRGDAYGALDPPLLCWVLATLVDSAVLGYELFIEPLSDAEKDAFFEETAGAARLLGVPRSTLPADFAGLRRSIAERVASGEVRVDDLGRSLGRDTLYPPRLWHVPRALFDLGALVTAGLLPPALREQYRLPWSRRHRAAFEVFARSVRWLVPRLPRSWRDVPQAREALRRVAS